MLSFDENMRAAGPEDTEQEQPASQDDRQKAADYLAAWQRCQADFINFKRRAEQERAEAGNAANAALLMAVLPAIDDLERAFTAVPPEIEGNNWVSGMRMIWRKLQSALEAQGLSQLKCLGEAFDPCVHEAVRRCAGPEGQVVQELEKGYRYREKLIRPSKVSVGEGEQEEYKEE